MRKRFVRESKVAASIDHPNVIPIYYAGEEDGVAYIAMRYVAGDDLRSLIRRERTLEPRPRRTPDRRRSAAALDAAHAAGLVHRDVKPANVLLGPDEHVYLTDFGLAKHALSIGGATQARATGSARSTTSRPSRSAASGSTRAPTSTRSAASSTSR